MEKVKKEHRILRIIRAIFIALISIIILIAVLLAWNANRQLFSKDYFKNIKTGGEIEHTYAQYGPFEVSYFEQQVPENYKKYEVWYPTEMVEGTQVYPVIVINNGTGMRASRSSACYDRLASWGFIVIANEEKYSWNGFAADMSLQYLLRANEKKTVFSISILIRKISG